METALAASGIAGLVLLVVLLVTLLVLLRERAASRRALVAAQGQTQELGERLEALASRVEQAAAERGTPDASETAYVITSAAQPPDGLVVPDRVVLSASLGEPLVKVLALGYGVRRALSAESRNRIRFEVRQEVRSSRRRRRRELKDLLRESRTAQRAEQDAA